MAITSFYGMASFLSNFSNISVRWEGILFPTAEHAYQAAKTLDMDERQAIADIRTPGRAKRAGQKVTLRPGWDEVRVEVMTEIVTAKFESLPIAMDKLVDTGDAELIEGNTWHDNFWGDCKCDACQDIEGQNHLGKILMAIRDNQG